MDFEPIIRDVKQMDVRIFLPRPMGLGAIVLDLQLCDRLSYDAGWNILFANFEGMAIRTLEDVQSVQRVFEAKCRGIGKQVSLMVNYDDFHLDDYVADEYFAMVDALHQKYYVADEYFAMVDALHQKYYRTASRFTTSAFMRMKLGTALCRRGVASHVFETHDEAMAFSERIAQATAGPMAVTQAT